jgi:hypothetical protein
MPVSMPVLLNFQLLHCFAYVRLREDGVSLEDTSCSPSPNFHDYPLRNSGPSRIPRCYPAEVMEEQLGELQPQYKHFAYATAYWLDIGNVPGGNQYYQSDNLGNVLTTTVYSLPANDSEIYVTLYSLVGSQWLNNAYTHISGP